MPEDSRTPLLPRSCEIALGLGAYGLWFIVYGLWFGVSGLGFTVHGLTFVASASALGVLGSGLSVQSFLLGFKGLRVLGRKETPCIKPERNDDSRNRSNRITRARKMISGIMQGP